MARRARERRREPTLTSGSHERRRAVLLIVTAACALVSALGVAVGVDAVTPSKPLTTTTKGARKCATLQPNDAVIAVCLQNDFMDERAADGSYVATAEGTRSSYAIPAGATSKDGLTLKRGTLAVGNAEQVVSVANQWLARGAAAKSRLMVTLDWHPKEHCSFCRFGKHGKQTLDCVWGCEGTQGLCVTGAGVPQEVFDSSNRCVDEISANDYVQSRYFQWPPHCVAGTFGAELDPYLQVPPQTTTLKTSLAIDRDSYSMYSAKEENSGSSMEDILKNENIGRVFVMGIATDMVVKNTLWDILSSKTLNNTGLQAVLVAAGVRGVFDEPGDYYLSSPESGSGVMKAEAIARGARIVASTSVDDALEELCQGTCDSDSDCDGDMVCDVTAEPYGRCQAKPISSGLAAAATFIALLGSLIVFRKDIIESVNNRHKSKGPPTSFVVLVETDIEGSSELWEKMGELGKGDIMKNGVMKLHDEVLRKSMKKYFGYELLVRGDAFLVAFHSVSDALSWALQVQLDLMEAAWPPESHNVTAGTQQEFGRYNGLRVRMGIHCGTVDKCIKHQGKIVYEGAVMKQVTSVADAGVGGGILLSQATLPLSANITIPYVMFDQGLHKMNDFTKPQRLKEIYPEALQSRCEVFAKLDTVERLTPSFHSAPEGDVTMIYTHVVGLADLQKAVGVKIMEDALSMVFETLRQVLMRSHCAGYDCRGYERNGENMYVFGDYKSCLLFALESQAELQKITWPSELTEHVKDSNIRGVPVRMGMHSGPLKRIRIPGEGLADYYGESANRAARVMSVAVGGQITCVETELNKVLAHESDNLPQIVIDQLGTFSLKGIPGVTSLVQVALTTALADNTVGKFKESKKAKLVNPPEKGAPRRIHKTSRSS